MRAFLLSIESSESGNKFQINFVRVSSLLYIHMFEQVSCFCPDFGLQNINLALEYMWICLVLHIVLTLCRFGLPLKWNRSFSRGASLVYLGHRCVNFLGSCDAVKSYRACNMIILWELASCKVCIRQWLWPCFTVNFPSVVWQHLHALGRQLERLLTSKCIESPQGLSWLLK